MLDRQNHSGISPDELLALVRRDDPGAHFADHTVNGCRVLVTTKIRPDRVRALAPNLQIHREIDFFRGEKGPSTLAAAWDELELEAEEVLAQAAELVSDDHRGVEIVKVDGNVL